MRQVTIASMIVLALFSMSASAQNYTTGDSVVTVEISDGQSGFAALSKSDYDEMTNYLSKGNMDGLQDMIDAQRVLWLKVGIKGNVIDQSILAGWVKVRIRVGEVQATVWTTRNVFRK